MTVDWTRRSRGGELHTGERCTRTPSRDAQGTGTRQAPGFGGLFWGGGGERFNGNTSLLGGTFVRRAPFPCRPPLRAGPSRPEVVRPSTRRRSAMVENASAAVLDSFRRRWQAELAREAPRRRRKSGGGRKRPREAEGEEPQAVRGWGGYGGLLGGLLEEEPPLQRLLRISPAPGPAVDPDPDAQTPGGGKEDLLGQLIQDLVCEISASAVSPHPLPDFRAWSPPPLFPQLGAFQGGLQSPLSPASRPASGLLLESTTLKIKEGPTTKQNVETTPPHVKQIV